jgi:hypothetical protein
MPATFAVSRQIARSLLTRWVKTSGVSPQGWLARSRILARISGPGEYRHDVVADAPRQSRRHVGNGQGGA